MTEHKTTEPLLTFTNYDNQTSKHHDNLQLFTNNPPNSTDYQKNENLSDHKGNKLESLEVETPHSQTTGTLVSDSRSPSEAYCIDCKKNIITVTTFHTGRNTHVMGGLLCCLGFYCCCCCLPYHVKDCKDVRHRCPYCDGLISIKKFTIL